MDTRSIRQHRTVLIGAALFAGMCGLGLIALRFWFHDWNFGNDRSRFGDRLWWAGVASQVLGYLAIGKFGFKIGLAIVGGLVGLVLWLRRPAVPDPDPSVTDQGVTGAGVTGAGVTGAGMTGPGLAEPDSIGSGSTGPDSTGPGLAGPDSTGSHAPGPDTVDGMDPTRRIDG